MEFLTNVNNLNVLKEAIDSAKEKIYICSAWIRSEILKRIFDKKWFIKHENSLPEIRFLIRMGCSNDFSITDIGNFLNLAARLKAKVRYTAHLHAKLNIVDDFFATVGSFNLTGGGYGDEFHSGSNEEIGVLIRDKEKVKQLTGLFEELWQKASTIEEEVIGFTLSEGTNRYVGYVGVKEIEIGKFVEIEAEDYEGQKRRWLGKVVIPYAHHTAFLPAITPENYDNSQFKEFINALTDESPLARYIKMVTLTKETGYAHLRSGRIEILKEIKEGNTLIFNRIAIPSAALIKSARPILLEKLFCGKNNALATIAANPEVKVGLNFKEILSKHMAIFGTTGSGKSYFAKRLVSKFYQWIRDLNGRVIILDTHNEYAKDNPDLPETLKDELTYIDATQIKQVMFKQIIDEDTNFNSLFGIKFTEEELKILKDAYKTSLGKKEELQKIEAFLKFIKRFTVPEQDNTEELIQNLKPIIQDQITEEMIERHICEELFNELASMRIKAEGLSPNSNDAKEIKKQIYEESLKRFKQTSSYKKFKQDSLNRAIASFLSPYYKTETRPAFSPEKYQQIKKVFDNKEVGFNQDDVIKMIEPPGVYVINLRDLSDDEERREIVGKFLNALFNKAKETNGNFKSLIVVEEAHNYAPEGSGKGSSSSRMLKKIASEGRKFDVGLLVITQRPAYISKDVIAQCNTSAIFRLINTHDISAIGNMVEAVSEELLTQLPAFDTGQCILTGVGVYEAVEVRIDNY